MQSLDTSRFYEVISDPGKRLAHEGEFFLWLLRRAPGRRVADLACGTGFHAEFLARNGAVVTARDIDEHAVAYATAHRSHKNITYETGDMRTAGGGPFDLAVITGNSLSMLPTHDDVGLTLGRVRSLLAADGLAFIQVINYSLFGRGGPRHKVARRATDGGETVVVKSMLPAAGVGALVAFAYFERTKETWRSHSEQAALLDVRQPEIEKAALEAGLALDACFGDYDRTPFVEDSSPDLLVVLSKRA